MDDLTPPPTDGSAAPCPSCDGTGYVHPGPEEFGEIRCHDCFGSGRQGDGWLEMTGPPDGPF